MTKKDSAKAISPITIVRAFNHPAERVFDFWSNPDQFKKWWKPAGFKMVNFYMEPRVGGEYTFEFLTPDGQVIMQYGRFHEIVPPAKLVFTNKCEARDGCEQETLITVEFSKKGESTEISVRQDMMPDQKCRDQAQQIWGGVLDRLEQELAQPS